MDGLILESPEEPLQHPIGLGLLNEGKAGGDAPLHRRRSNLIHTELASKLDFLLLGVAPNQGGENRPLPAA